MTQTDSIAALLKSFRSTKRFLITSHSRPDGDAVGSVLALGEILNQLGCETRMVLSDPPPFIYRALPGLHNIIVSTDAGAEDIPAIILECDCIERTGLQVLTGRSLLNLDPHSHANPSPAANCHPHTASAS